MKKDNILGYLFSVSTRCYKKVVNQELEKYNLTTMQCGVIRTLRYGGDMTQAEIADIYSSDRATIGSVIQKLEEKKYLERKLSSKDRRAYSVSLTPKAVKIADELEKISDSIEKRAFEGLSKEQVQDFYRTLNTIIKNLS